MQPQTNGVPKDQSSSNQAYIVYSLCIWPYKLSDGRSFTMWIGSWVCMDSSPHAPGAYLVNQSCYWYVSYRMSFAKAFQFILLYMPNAMENSSV